ncbi:hypothetical protein SKAU_G00137100 [Synaphobranchus kaupii]|uniref:Uncharacterized protein n=1 Tax=Synaphobranchus kaupii TaxID=118154 RepID=A0A9Q1J2X7_SYNKA|nr:hypothetical protein SKAU_G00137100 [Synaphobranchus kaupii]
MWPVSFASIRRMRLSSPDGEIQPSRDGSSVEGDGPAGFGEPCKGCQKIGKLKENLQDWLSDSVVEQHKESETGVREFYQKSLFVGASETTYRGRD